MKTKEKGWSDFSFISLNDSTFTLKTMDALASRSQFGYFRLKIYFSDYRLYVEPEPPSLASARHHVTDSNAMDPKSLTEGLACCAGLVLRSLW